MKRCCRNGEQASLSPLPTPIAAASPSPPNSGTITPRRAIMNDALPVLLSSLTSVVSPAVNISTITPISDSSEMNSVSFTTLRTAGPSITPDYLRQFHFLCYKSENFGRKQYKCNKQYVAVFFHDFTSFPRRHYMTLMRKNNDLQHFTLCKSSLIFRILL